MDKSIKYALKASSSEYALVANLDAAPFAARISDVFVAGQPYMEKVALQDRVFDDYPHFEALREVYFDLLLMNFFSADLKKLEVDYLESDEWEAIENQTLDRGTELLNLLLYLQECRDADVEAGLNDYLKEFLLVDEDEFQDEHQIYEPVIENQLLVDSSYSEIARIAARLDPELEIAGLFYPMLGFFSEKTPTEGQFREYVEHSKEKAFDAAVLALLVAYHQPNES